MLQIVYTTLMDGFVRVGDLESAQRMLQDMRACGLQPNTITFNILLRGICECPDKPVEVRGVDMPDSQTFHDAHLITLLHKQCCMQGGRPEQTPIAS